MTTILIRSILISMLCFLYVHSTNENAFLHKYSEIDYDRASLHENHRRVQRSVDSHVELKLKNNNQEFNLKLKPVVKNHFVNKEIEVISNKEKRVKVLDNIHYEGHLIDEPDTSTVTGSIIDGLFTGTIESKKNGKFQVESAKRYNSNTKAHSIIYHENDVKDSEEIKKARKSESKSSEGVGCGSHSKEVHDLLEKEQKTLKPIERVKKSVENNLFKYSKEANLNNSHSHLRRKRATALNFPQGKSVCSLYIKIDPTYYTDILNTEGGGNADTALAYITSYISSYIDNLNAIYNPLQFSASSDTYYTGVEFKIYRMKVYTSSVCGSSSLNDNEKKICDKYLDAVTFLNYVSLDDLSNYCLGYAFTSRDFGDGTLGLAWVASNTGSVGGICEQRASVQGVEKSLNSGIVTINNYQSRVPELVTKLTLAHEVGHSFGSQHDPDGSCSPGGTAGNYIMYSRATKGENPNNNKFSSCSMEQMGNILNYVVEKKFCFESPSVSVCGNGIIEGDEQCDCGFPDQCTDTCCDSQTCTLTSGSVCSPSQGVCCEPSCVFSPTTKTCSQSTDCKGASTCNGQASTCPTQSSIAVDLTACNENTQVCISGVCTGSICQKYQMTQCYLSGNLSDPNVNKRDLCHLACTGDNTNNVCTDSFKIPAITTVYNEGVVMKPGSLCSGTDGYCDAFSNCRSADTNSRLSKLLATLLSPVTFEDIKQWVETYWWAVLIFVILFLILFNLVIWGLSKLMPSSNPNRPIKHNKTHPKHIRRTESTTSTIGLTTKRRERPVVFTTDIADNVDEDTYNNERRKNKSKHNRNILF